MDNEGSTPPCVGGDSNPTKNKSKRQQSRFVFKSNLRSTLMVGNTASPSGQASGQPTASSKWKGVRSVGAPQSLVGLSTPSPGCGTNKSLLLTRAKRRGPITANKYPHTTHPAFLTQQPSKKLKYPYGG